MTLKQRRHGPCSHGHREWNVTCEGPAEMGDVRFQKRAIDATARSQLASQRRHSPSWASRNEYEFVGLEWREGIPGRRAREYGRHGRGMFRELGTSGRGYGEEAPRV